MTWRARWAVLGAVLAVAFLPQSAWAADPTDTATTATTTTVTTTATVTATATPSTTTVTATAIPTGPLATNATLDPDQFAVVTVGLGFLVFGVTCLLVQGLRR